MKASLRSALKQLRLSGLLESLEVRLHEAAGNGLTHAQFLEIIVHDELAVRGDRRVQRRGKAAQLPPMKTLEGFHWSVNPSIQRKLQYHPAACPAVADPPDV